jgi:hypothetical protein
MTRPGGFERDAELDQKGFENVLKLRAEVEGQWGGQVSPVNNYYDDTYYQAAMAKTNPAKWGPRRILPVSCGRRAERARW